MASLKRLLLVALLASAALCAVSTVASAQWYKPWKWGKPPQVPQLPQVPQMPTLPSIPSMGGNNAQQGGQQPAMGQAVQQAPLAAAPAAPTLTPQQIEDRRLLVARARERDTACDSTVACAKDRLELWKMVQIDDPASVEGRLNYDRAQRDIQAAEKREEKQTAKDETQKTDLANQLREADRSFRSGDFDNAAAIVNEVLQSSPNDSKAMILRSRIEIASERRSTMIRLAIVAIIAVVVIVLLVWLAIVAARRHRAAKTADTMVAESRRATIQVVDGVGRGRSAAMAEAVFRIGATAGDEGTRNDLVLSDADARISRYHCNVTRRDGRFYLIDTSSNGTTLNGSPLARGEPKRIKSGDMVVLAESSALVLTVH